MRRLLGCFLSLATIALLLVGCGSNRPSRGPVLVKNEADLIVDDRFNDSEDLIEMLKPVAKKGDLQIDLSMLDKTWDPTKADDFDVQNVNWPDGKDDANLKAKIDQAKERYKTAKDQYEKNLESIASDKRKEEIEKVGTYYLAFMSKKKDPSLQDLESWKQSLRRSGKDGFRLRKKHDGGKFEMTMACDPNGKDQIIAIHGESEKDGTKYVAVVKGGGVDVQKAKADTLKEVVDKQYFQLLFGAYVDFKASLAVTKEKASRSGFIDHVTKKSYWKLSSMIADKTISINDLETRKNNYVAAQRKGDDSKGLWVLDESGTLTRMKADMIGKIFMD